MDEQEETERWRVAGLVLSRVSPAAFEALLIAAENLIAETPEATPEISIVDLVS